MTRAKPSVADFEIVIGLEVHVHLKTESKMFCGCAVRYGDSPNTRTCPVCLALPGALPVMNERAVELAVRAGLALGCEVRERSVMARKNYFYPDLPKGYQISQYDQPINARGMLEISVEENGAWATKQIGITRIHLEEDAGKSIHEDGAVGVDVSQMDLNRSGVPLIEIVSEPDLRSAQEAGAYLRALHDIIRYIDVSDADMEKGQFRCDANVSLRSRAKAGSAEFGTRTEIKNLNSFRFVEEAIQAEVRRQRKILEQGGEIVQATLTFDRHAKQTRVLRTKENAHDYRYFPEPDLLPIVVDSARIAQIRATLPELPAQKRERFQTQYGLSQYDARLLSESREIADFFESAAQTHGKAKSVANWILRDLLKLLKEQEVKLTRLALLPTTFAKLILLVDVGKITAKSAQEILPELALRGGDPDALVAERGLAIVADSGALASVIDAVIAANPDAKERYCAGEEKVLNFLMGQVMKQTQGKASPAQVRECLIQKFKE